MSASAITRSGFDMSFLLSDNAREWYYRTRSSPFPFGGIIVNFRTDRPLLHLSRSENMTTTRSSYLAVAGVSLLLAACQVPPGASQSTVSAPPVGASDLGGTVTSANGPEAGVWVIAETTDLPTKFAKIVVTDDRGRYLIPELPKANYSVWVRGYGLVDSPKVQAAPGKILNRSEERRVGKECRSRWSPYH